MALAFLNRCVWRATSTGTGDFVVASAITGYKVPEDCLAPVVVDANTYFYFAQSDDKTQWEIGYGIYTTIDDTLTRATILDSTNAAAAVSFSAAPSVFMGTTLANDWPFSGAALNGVTQGNKIVIFSGSGENGGAIEIEGGEGTTSNGGSFQLTAGNGQTQGGNFQASAGGGLAGSGGNLNFIGGDGLATSGGAANFRAGNGETTGGAINFIAGDGNTGNGGAIIFLSGTSSAAIGGDISFTASGGDTDGGGVLFTAGDGATGTGGALSFQSGAGTTGGGGSLTVNAGGGATNGGSFFMNAGDGTAGDGGEFQITSGDGDGNGGSVSIQAGIGNTGNAGSVNVVAGSSTDGAGGNVDTTSGNSTNFSGGRIGLFPGIGGVNGGDVAITLPPAGSGRQGLMILTNVPTADPAVTDALWNAGGLLAFSGSGSAVTNPMTSNLDVGGFSIIGADDAVGGTDGGPITIQSGAGTTNNGGVIAITPGAGAVDGGDVTFTLPAAGSGRQGLVIITGLPTSDPGVSGALYVTAGAILISP